MGEGRELMPGAGMVAAAVTAVQPRIGMDRRGDLTRAKLFDLEGRFLMVAWLPPRARHVRRGDRIFLHYEGDQWWQVPVVEVDNGGHPM